MFLFYPKFPRLHQHEMGTMWFNFNVMPPAFKTVAVIGRYNTAEIAESLLGLATQLQQRGCAVLIEKETAANIGGNGFTSGDYAAIGAQADLAVVLGGDGSMLSAARHLAAHGVPLVGVNQGRLGFMTDIAFSHMRETIDLLLSGQYTMGERTMLEAQVLRGEKEIFRTQALNDIVVNKGATGRMIEFLVHIDGQFVRAFIQWAHPAAQPSRRGSGSGLPAYAVQPPDHRERPVCDRDYHQAARHRGASAFRWSAAF
jgi:hypothetical protein